MRGCIHIYCGDGKGKTTAAVGLAVRAAGAGLRVLLVQFLKGRKSSELAVLEQIPQIVLMRAKHSGKFTFQMNDREKAACREAQQACLANALEQAFMGNFDLLILDEIMAAYHSGMLTEEQLKNLIQQKPESLELVLTGRNPPEFLIQSADYLSEICNRKHPFDEGIAARRGIEF